MISHLWFWQWLGCGQGPLPGELWGVCCEFFWENWLHYITAPHYYGIYYWSLWSTKHILTSTIVKPVHLDGCCPTGTNILLKKNCWIHSTWPQFAQANWGEFVRPTGIGQLPGHMIRVTWFSRSRGWFIRALTPADSTSKYWNERRSNVQLPILRNKWGGVLLKFA